MNPKRHTEAIIGQTKVLCPQCESAYLTIRHCKSICLTCGYVESCEDNFIPNQDNPVEKDCRIGKK